MYGFGHKLFILQEEPKYVTMQDVQFLMGIWQETLVLVLDCTTHLQICYLV